MSEKYQIVIDPELGIIPETFVKVWNENDTALQAGRVVVSETESSTFDPNFAVLFLTTAIGIAASVLTNLISDTIIKTSQPKQKPEISQKTLPDGTKIIVVTLRES